MTLYSDVSEKKAAVQQLEQLASKDGLTELANRRIFDWRLEEAFKTAQSSSASLSLLMIDVDNFKAYNDTYGHPAGDEVLRQIAAVLRSACRGELDLVGACRKHFLSARLSPEHPRFHALLTFCSPKRRASKSF